MPRLWEETIEAHRDAVREAILDATAALVGEHGVAGAKMARIAAEAGIGRATLYKYFADVEAILHAWHARQVERHLQHLQQVAHPTQGDAGAGEPLEAVLLAYAEMTFEHRGGELATLVHHGEHFAHAQRRLVAFFEHLIEEGVRAGQLRSDVPAEELAQFCAHALDAAREASSPAAVQRLVATILDGLRHNT